MPKSAQRFESFAALYDKLCQILFYIFEGFYFGGGGVEAISRMINTSPYTCISEILTNLSLISEIM